MKKADTNVYKERLLALRARLRGDVSNLADAALRKSGSEGADSTSMPIHMAELGSENFEQEFTLSLMQAEENTLELIEEAIERVEGGTFGKCVECGGVIPKLRLNAIPYTPVCIRCAEAMEGA
jgi:DnaK suppressor protein